MTTRDVFAAIYGDYAVHDMFVAFFQQYELFLTPTIATPLYASGIFGPSEVSGEAVSSPLEPFFTPHRSACCKRASGFHGQWFTGRLADCWASLR
jgi:hypothetical protein